MLDRLTNIIHSYWNKYILFTQPYLHKYALVRMKFKPTKNIVFFATFISTWKHDKLYELLEESNDFVPTIVVCPIVNLGYDNMLMTMDACYLYLKSKGYRVIRAYDSFYDKYYNPKDLKPDVIIYTSPYSSQVDKRYRINKYRSVLGVYMPYGFALSADVNLLFNQPVHNLSYKLFYETDLHKLMAIEYADNKGCNVEVSGALIFDKIDEERKYLQVDCLKQKKTIIWAPHHTIDEDGFSSFLTISQYMLSLAEKYQDSINWIFKPHPLLKSNLYRHPQWGKSKTDEYYTMWNSSEYSTLADGEYAKLFVESDALILDSISFVAEYLYVNKPILFTSMHPNLSHKFNRFGQKAMECVYRITKEDDIENFIQNLLDANDILKKVRDKFFRELLYPKVSPSNYVYNFLKKL